MVRLAHVGRTLATGALALSLLSTPSAPAAVAAGASTELCATYTVTAYYPDPAYGFNTLTADGTSAFTSESIVAAHPSIPFGTLVTIDGFTDVYRVADRGLLATDHLDIRAASYGEAVTIGRSRRRACLTLTPLLST